METHVILLVGTILLSGGCIGLLIVRLTNPFFQGAGWLGVFFASGALAAMVFTTTIERDSRVLLVVADALILLAFVFLHVCFLELSDSDSRIPRLGILVLLAQLLSFFFFLHLHDARQLSAVTLGLAVAVQASESAWLLKNTNKAGMGAPIWFNITLLLGFAIFNLVRSTVIFIVGTPSSPESPNPLQATAAMVYIGAAIGLGFGVFWMEGHQIRLKLEHLASVDPLTGIYNRRSFVAFCEQELLKAARSGEAFSLIMFDLDHFKTVNDRYGHRAGDSLLCAVVEKLRNSVRNIDIVARWGGEEFVALLPKADSGAALLVAQRLRQHVESIAMVGEQMNRSQARAAGSEEAIKITLSIGVATYLGHPRATINELLHQCDAAMYQAKAEGRDRIVCTNAQLAMGWRLAAETCDGLE